MTTPLVANIKTEKGAHTSVDVDTNGPEKVEELEIGVEENGNAVNLFCFIPEKEETVKPKDTKYSKTENIEEVSVKTEDVVALKSEEVHIKSESEDDIIYECENCSYSTWNQYALKSHFKRRHEKEKPKPSICDQCGFGASTKQVLIEHMIRIHSIKMPGVKYLDCDCCDFKTTIIWKLTKHKRTHSKEKVTCTICQKRYKVGSIYAHWRTVHRCHSIGVQLLGPFKCAHCRFEVMSKVVLRDHIIAEHPGDRQMKAQKASSLFSSKTQQTEVEPEVPEVNVENMKKEVLVR